MSRKKSRREKGQGSIHTEYSSSTQDSTEADKQDLSSTDNENSLDSTETDNQESKKSPKVEKKNKKRELANTKFQNDLDKRVEDLRKQKMSAKKVLIWLLLLPFRIVEFFFRFFYGILNVLLIILIGGIFVGTIIAIKVYPMYQEASTTAYTKLASLKDSNFRMLGNTKIYDKNDKIIGEINAGDYKYVPINKVSPFIQNGYIATEDRRFTEHIGIDVQSLARAGLSLIKHNGEITQGGSTITQQVIKNNLLSQEQSYSRKLVEILIAPKIEQEYSKAKIMEFYVNTNYYGNGCYGIETASRFYFNKHCKDLTLAEAAMLCGVSNSPNNYNPIKSMKLATEKEHQVLKNMLHEDYISQDEYDKALEQEIRVRATVDEYDNDNYMISYALYSTALELMKKDGFKFKYIFSSSEEQSKYAEEYSKAYAEKASLLRAGGYKIHTSFDTKLQAKLQRSIDKSLRGYTEKQKNKKYALQSSGVCIDNQTGYIVAMVGGRGEKDEFNRAFLSTRQPGSSIKPLLVYAPSINDGVITPSSVYTDKKVYARPNDTSSYSPSNSGGGFRGDMPIREALARSINTIAFQLYQDTTPQIAMSYLDKMQFTTLSSVDNHALSLCLGGFTNGVRIVDLAKGYATLPMGGKYTTRTCIRYVDHEVKGKVLDDTNLEDTESEVFTPDTAFMMCDMMQGTLKEDYGTAHRIYNKNMIAGGKTGTTSSNKDAWFSGFSKYYTTTVWVGYDTPRVMEGMYGGTVPAEIWSKFMTGIKKNMTKADFDKPDTIALRKAHGTSYAGKNLKLVKMGKHTWYETRKLGTEWYSKINDYMLATKQKEREIQLAYNLAKSKANDFLDYRIGSVTQALSLDDTYAKVIGYIEAVDDDYKSKRLKKEVTKYYEALVKVVKNDWKSFIAEYEQSEKDEEIARQKVNIEESKHEALRQLKNNRINKMEWYIAEMYRRSFNTDVTKLLVSDAEEALERLKGYSEYKTYQRNFNKAKAYVNGLPDKIVMPEIPHDDEDDTYIDTRKYYDSAVAEYKKRKKELENYINNKPTPTKKPKPTPKPTSKPTPKPEKSPAPTKKPIKTPTPVPSPTTTPNEDSESILAKIRKSFMSWY